MDTEIEVLKRHYSQLIGYKIVDVFVVDGELTDSPSVAFILKKGNEELLAMLYSDPEGNDTGFLEISVWQDENS